MDEHDVAIPLDELEPSVPKPFEAFGAEMVLVRDGDAVHALAAKCPHAGAPFAKGAVHDGVLVCPWHKAAFALDTGAVLCPPALTGLARWRTTVRDGVVRIHAGAQAPATRPPVEGAPPRIAIVGAGAAASGALAELAARGATGAVTLIEPEGAAPYDRTVLSKMVVSGKAAAKPKAVLDAQALAPPLTRVHGRVATVDGERNEILLDDGTAIAFDRALVATGSEARRPDLPGLELDGVHLLRDVADAASLVASIEAGVARGGPARAVVVGSGFIGLEAASGLRARGFEVTVVSPDAVPFASRFGERIGRRIRALHEAEGTRFLEGSAAAMVPHPDREGAVGGVRLEDGAELDCDLVLVGLGASPLGGVLDAADPHGAVEVDRTMRVSGGIHAAGDIARFPYNGETIRVEHWQVAQAQGVLAARAMLGDDAGLDAVPFFWSAQCGKRFDYLGHAERWDEILFDGEVEQDAFVALFVSGGHVRAAMGCARDAAMARLSRVLLLPTTPAEARAVL